MTTLSYQIPSKLSLQAIHKFDYYRNDMIDDLLKPNSPGDIQAGTY